MANLPITRSYLMTQLKNFDDDFLDEKYLQSSDIAIEKQGTPTSGMLSSYKLKFTDSTGATSYLGDTIDIPKDYLVKSAEVKTCTVDDDPVIGYKVGDKYIDFIINTKDGSETDTHIYIAFKEFLDLDAGDGIKISGQEISVNYVANDGLTVTAAAGSTENQLTLDYETSNINFSTNPWS